MKTAVTTSILALMVTTPQGLMAGSHTNSPHHTDLKKQIADLSKRIQDFENRENQPGHALTDKEAVIKESPLSLKLSGMINRAILWHSNGKNSNTVHVDNDNAPTRLNITAIGKYSESLSVGATIEAALKSNSTESVDVKNAPNTNFNFSRRKIEVFAQHKALGDVYLGHGPMASDSTMEATDFSKTGVVSEGASVQFTAEGTRFFDSTSNAKSVIDVQTPTVNTVFDSGDGLSRRDRIRYNSPSFAGFSLQTSHSYAARSDNWDVALKFAGDIGQTKLAAQVAHSTNNSLTRAATAGTIPTKYKQINGSAGILFENGISLFAGIVNRDWNLANVPNAKVYHGKLGYQHKFFEAGLTAFAVDYGHFTNMIFDSRTGFERDKYLGKTYGIMAVQFLDRIGTEVYMIYRHHRLEGPSARAARFNDVKALMTGMRVKF